ncbi:pectate lyase [Croceibacterium ferulae]|uniref:pectate lyase n=1 Tax=Croceibacterium ferulae TaxID=1854641 RepID=UPI001F4DD672|nr:pectate lyase [Croceibacterium ferulae]
MTHTRTLALLLALATPMTAGAEVIGTTVPLQGLTAADIATALPAGPEREVWLAWLARSEAAMARDKAVLTQERDALAAAGQSVPAPPPEGNSSATMPLDRDAEWYGGAEARSVADNIVSFQTPAGGWGKNQDRTGAPRAPGQGYTPSIGKDSRYAAQDGAGGWNFVGTLDNDATIRELAFLARVQEQLPGATGDAYRQSFERGVRYMLAAEMPGGGWPQVWPLQGLYHDALTLNDNMLVGTAELLQQVGSGSAPYAFVSADLRAEAAAAAVRAVDVLLELQVEVDGQPTIWAQQYDPLTRRPVPARNYEMIALSTGESAPVLAFLMRQDRSDPRIARAVDAGARWYADHAISDRAWRRVSESGGRQLVPEAAAAPLWARFYSIETGQPIFGDRDLTIHDDVNAISLERRNGYGWFNSSGAKVARDHAAWAAGQ